MQASAPVSVPPPPSLSPRRVFDLADSHARPCHDKAQQRILDRLPELFITSSQTLSRSRVETEFIRAFHHVSGQRAALDHPHLLRPSTDAAFDLVASLLGRRGKSAALVVPCRRELDEALQKHGVRHTAVSEGVLADSGHRRLARLLLADNAPDALVVTLPGDPTGFALDKAAFGRLAKLCAQTGTLLVIDFSYRFYEQYETWDQYRILNESGTQYICLEQTGRTWPTAGLDCGFLITSPDLDAALSDPPALGPVPDVPAFALALATAYLCDTARRGLDRAVRSAVRINRMELRSTLRGSVLAPVTPHGRLSVEWVGIGSRDLVGADVAELFGTVGITVAPGTGFLCPSPVEAARHVRIALARDVHEFRMACGRLRHLIAGAAQLS